MFIPFDFVILLLGLKFKKVTSLFLKMYVHLLT